MKTIEAIKAYAAINESKLTKLSGADKITVVRIAKVLKPIVKEYEEFVVDAQERLKSEGFDEMVRKAQQWRKEGESTSLSVEERGEINAFFNNYNMLVAKCLTEEENKDVVVDCPKLSEEGFVAFVGDNDFSVETIALIEEVMR